jgi:acetyl-CoA carboxylase carboxyl transferase subunit beta
MTWFKRESSELDTSGEKKIRTEGLWVKCEQCRQVIWKKDLEENLNCCPKCEKHFRIDARTRLAQLLDDGAYETDDGNLVSIDPLKFVDLKPYSSRLTAARKETGLNDAVINARGKLNGRPVIVSAMEYSFIGGSMGAVVGEMITRAVDDAKVPYVSVLTDPTTGGVTASFAMLGDLNIAEPGALIGFAGPRVIEQTIRQKLPAGFQRAEFLLEHGMLDAVVPRKEMKPYIARALEFMTKAA